MGRRQARRFRPELDSLEVRAVLSVSNPIVHSAIAPIAVPIGTYNNTFTQISNAFYAYEGPLDDTLNALGSLASTIINPNSSSDPNSSDNSYVSSSKGDPNALEGRLVSAIGKLPGGQAEANAILNRAFQYGGLTTTNAPYFKAKVSALVKQYVTQQIKRGEMVLVWPGQASTPRRS